jgi:multiple sugar transport system permease protein
MSQATVAPSCPETRAVPSAKGPGRGRSRARRQEARDAYLMLSPWIIGFLVLFAAPMIISLLLAFTEWNLVNAPKWVGFGNFVTLFHDPLIRTALINTAFYAFISTPLYACIGLALSIALYKRIRGVRWYRTVYFIPSIVPAVSATLIWLLIFEPPFGVIDHLLSLLHLPVQPFLSSPQQAKPTLILLYLWGVGASMPIFLAGLNAIPSDLYEAASVDGASSWQAFKRVTLPLLSPVVFFIFITGFIAGFQVFTPAYVATQGQGTPDNSTLFYVLYLYNNAFQYFKMGYASAMAWLLFLIILGFTIVQFGIARRAVYYESSPTE